MSGAAQPLFRRHHHHRIPGACAPGERWVYVSSTPDASYNPSAMTTSSLGAKSLVSPSSKGDAFDDGVTLSIDGPDQASVSYSVEEAVDPTTVITIDRVVVVAGDHSTVYQGAAAQPNTPMTSPEHWTSATGAIIRAFLCYLLSVAPPMTPEVPYAVVLPLAGIAVGAVVLAARRRRAVANARS
jgi:hypothetical protein